VDDPEKRFTELYDEHYRRVFAYALANAGRETAEDVASETFLIAWRRRADVPDQPLPWLLGVARNLLHQQRAGGGRRRALADRVAALTTPEDLAAWDVADHVIERDGALAAVAALSERDLEVLALVMWHDLGPRDAAKVVGCSPAAFFVRLHRARRRLARAMNAADTAPSPGRVRRTGSFAAERPSEAWEKS
jgi:RNA polymerase sigma factor (sigma-70 family)